MEYVLRSASSIEEEIAPLREKLQNHRLYNNLKSLEDVRIFMESHVYAVWDFMSLLKALQRDMTRSQLPWIPPTNPTLARFINEIVLDEESDIDQEGVVQSHFEMYLSAMDELRADHSNMDQLLDLLRDGTPFSITMIPESVDRRTRQFVNFTMDTAQSGKSIAIASAFAFGREEIIPEMFLEILKNADPESKHYDRLRYYLERHIELDGDEHGPLAMKMIEELCGEDQDKWKEASEYAMKALTFRIALWDAIDDQIHISKRLN